MGWGSLIGGAISLASSLFSSSEKDKASSKAQNTNKAINNALYSWQKKQIEWKKSIDLQEVKRQASIVRSSQRAGYAASGVKYVAGDETSADIMIRETDRLALQDEEVIKKQAEYDIGAAKKNAELGNASMTKTNTVGATLLTKGTRFVTEGLSDSGNSFYGFSF